MELRPAANHRAHRAPKRRWKMRNRTFGYWLPVFLAVALLAVSACAVPPEEAAAPGSEDTTVTPEASQEESETPVTEPEPEKQEYRPTYSALGRRLRDSVLQGGLEKLWKEYTVQSDDCIKIKVGTGGNIYAYHDLPVNQVLLAEADVENAVSLLINGRLPDEPVTRAVDPEEVAELLIEATLYMEDFDYGLQPTAEGLINWLREQPIEDISTEGTMQQVVEEFDFISDCIQKCIDSIADVLDDLPGALTDDGTLPSGRIA
jgi:hypothetical protein